MGSRLRGNDSKESFSRFGFELEPWVSGARGNQSAGTGQRREVMIGIAQQ